MRHGRHSTCPPNTLQVESHLVSRSPAALALPLTVRVTLRLVSSLLGAPVSFTVRMGGGKAHMPMVSPAQHSTDQSGSQRSLLSKLKPLVAKPWAMAGRDHGGWVGDPWRAIEEELYAHWHGKMLMCQQAACHSGTHRPHFSLRRCRDRSGLEGTGPPSEEGL